jgi:hypothetical protein
MTPNSVTKVSAKLKLLRRVLKRWAKSLRFEKLDQSVQPDPNCS